MNKAKSKKRIRYNRINCFESSSFQSEVVIQELQSYDEI